MEKAVLRLKFAQPIQIEQREFNSFSQYVMEYLEANLQTAEIICAESFTLVDQQADFHSLDGQGGPFSFIEIICQIDEKLLENCNEHHQEIVDYLLKILDEETISLTDINYQDDDKFITITSNRLLPL